MLDFIQLVNGQAILPQSFTKSLCSSPSPAIPDPKRRKDAGNEETSEQAEAYGEHERNDVDELSLEEDLTRLQWSTEESHKANYGPGEDSRKQNESHDLLGSGVPFELIDIRLLVVHYQDAEDVRDEVVRVVDERAATFPSSNCTIQEVDTEE